MEPVRKSSIKNALYTNDPVRKAEVIGEMIAERKKVEEMLKCAKTHTDITLTMAGAKNDPNYTCKIDGYHLRSKVSDAIKKVLEDEIADINKDILEVMTYEPSK